MANRLPKPRDLGNDQMCIRTTKEGIILAAETRQTLDLTLKTDRAVVERFANRLLDMCHWWERKTEETL